MTRIKPDPRLEDNLITLQCNKSPYGYHCFHKIDSMKGEIGYKCCWCGKTKFPEYIKSDNKMHGDRLCLKIKSGV